MHFNNQMMDPTAHSLLIIPFLYMESVSCTGVACIGFTLPILQTHTRDSLVNIDE